MTWLFRLLPYAKWVLGVLGVASMVGSFMYANHARVEKEIAQRAHDQVVEQLESVTRELEQERIRHQEESARIDEAHEEASDIEDSQDPAPESTRHLLNELYGS